jgi:hypothetical protein
LCEFFGRHVSIGARAGDALHNFITRKRTPIRACASELRRKNSLATAASGASVAAFVTGHTSEPLEYDHVSASYPKTTNMSYRHSSSKHLFQYWRQVSLVKTPFFKDGRSDEFSSG